MPLEDRVTISTAEGIELELLLAGLGSRFGAALIDVVIQLVLVLAVTLGLGLATGGVGDGWIGALYLVLAFLIIFGYDVAFESLNSGRTPGKLAAGLRVVRSTGQPVGFLTSSVRNLLRIVDFLPLFYGVGATSIFVTGNDQRLGDLAAQTLVVRERIAAPPPMLTLGPNAMARDATFLAWDVSTVTPDETATVRRYLERRPQLSLAARAQLSWELCERLRPKVSGLPRTWPAETVLEGIVAAKSTRA
jgi:uncharacterized RDD family membrane protein YckC